MGDYNINKFMFSKPALNCLKGKVMHENCLRHFHPNSGYHDIPTGYRLGWNWIYYREGDYNLWEVNVPTFIGFLNDLR